MQTVAIIAIIDKRGIFLVSFYSVGGVGGRVLEYITMGRNMMVMSFNWIKK